MKNLTSFWNQNLSSVICLLLLVFSSLSVFAQNKELWQADTEGKEVVWTKLSPNRDVLLAGTTNMIVFGIDAYSGKVLWESTAVRPFGGKLFMSKEIKNKLKKTPEAFYEQLVKFEENPENEELNNIVAIFDANMVAPTLINVKTGFEMNYMQAAKMSLAAYFYDDTRLLTGTQEMKTVMRSLPSGDAIWISDIAINAPPIIDKEGFVYINSSRQLNKDIAGNAQVATNGASANMTDNNTTIAKLDPTTGETLWKISEKGEIFENAQLVGSNDLLFFRLRKNYFTAQSIDLVDINTGKLKWQFDISDDKANIEYTSISPNGKVLYVLMRRNKRVDFFAVDLTSGQRIWLQEFKLKKEDQATLVATNYGAAVVSLKRVRMFDLATGEEKWEHKYSGDTPGFMIPTDGGELLLFSDGDIESLDPNTGDDIWDAKGGILLKLYDDKMLASYKTKGCVMIDLKTGDRIWKSKVFIQQIVVDAPGIGLVYKELDGDDVEMNILDLNTGKPIWDDPIENPAADFVTENGTMLLYSDERILEFFPKTGQYKVFMDGVEFEQKESPNKIESYGDNLLISSSQNLMLVSKEGKVLYKVDYKPAPQSVGKSILGGAMAAAAIAGAAVSAAAAVQQSANAGYARGSADFIAADRYQAKADGATAMAGSFAGLAMGGIGYATKKYKKTSSSANYVFMLTKEDGDIKIVKLAKATGAKEKELIFKEREPVYLYDNVRQVLFYRTDNSVMSCFEF